MLIILETDSKVYKVHSIEIIKAVAKELDSVSLVDAIRFVRSATNMELKEAISFVEGLRNKNQTQG